MPYVVTRPIRVTHKFRKTPATLQPGDVVLVQGQYLWGLRPDSIKCKLWVPDNADDLKSLQDESKITNEVTPEQSRERLLAALTGLDELPRLATESLQRRAYDLGHVRDWPYWNQKHWMKQMNREIKHPSLMVEPQRMSDGMHLTVVYYGSW